ncbi:MAG: hypothetical protein ACOZQL_26330 [Myxococcota bacterium]
MRRALFYGWLLGSGALLGGVAWSAFPHTSAWMIALAFWAVAVVPLSFKLWFDAQHRREEADVDAAIEAWRTKAPGAGAKLAVALEEALDEEDERSMERLLAALEREPDAAPFIAAARTWMKDDGGRASRDEHLDAARELARPLLPRLTAHG